MKAYIIAGEASGDLHGGNLARALKAQSPDLQLRGWGGDCMSDAGVEVTKHYRELAFMGFVEVLMNVRTCLLYTSPSPRDRTRSRMPSSA